MLGILPIRASVLQLLYLAMSVEMKRELKAKKANVMAKLADMPDSQLKAGLTATPDGDGFQSKRSRGHGCDDL